MKAGKKIWFWYGAGHLECVIFIRWCKTEMGNGREDTHKKGVGAIIKSDWLFKLNGGKRTQHILRPYMPIYKTKKSATRHRNEIKRPKLEKLKLKL